MRVNMRFDSVSLAELRELLEVMHRAAGATAAVGLNGPEHFSLETGPVSIGVARELLDPEPF